MHLLHLHAASLPSVKSIDVMTPVDDRLYNSHGYSQIHEGDQSGRSSLFTIMSLLDKHRRSHSEEKGSRRTTCALVLSHAIQISPSRRVQPFLLRVYAESREHTDQTAR